MGDETNKKHKETLAIHWHNFKEEKMEQVEVFEEEDADELKRKMNRWHKTHEEATVTRTEAYGIPMSAGGTLTSPLHVVIMWYTERQPDEL